MPPIDLWSVTIAAGILISTNSSIRGVFSPAKRKQVAACASLYIPHNFSYSLFNCHSTLDKEAGISQAYDFLYTNRTGVRNLELFCVLKSESHQFTRFSIAPALAIPFSFFAPRSGTHYCHVLKSFMVGGSSSALTFMEGSSATYSSTSGKMVP
jgi:hypothetical protein